MISDARRAFAEIAAQPDESLEMDRASLLIAAEEYPDLLVQKYLERLDQLGQRVSERLYKDAGPHETIARLNQVLFDEEGFKGNKETYYDPRNSYLNEVLDRRLGIPITLSALYMEVGRRIGFALEGVGFPGHFLVKHRIDSRSEIFVDAFSGGQILTKETCQARLNELYDGKLKFRPEFLRTTSRRKMLFRLLNNLKNIYVRRRDMARALAAVERMLLLIPDSSHEVRDRGILLSQLGRPLEALRELVRYRQSSSKRTDREKIDDLIERLKTQVGMSN